MPEFTYLFTKPYYDIFGETVWGENEWGRWDSRLLAEYPNFDLEKNVFYSD